MCWGFREGVLMSAGGMLQECRSRGFFRGGLHDQGRCGPGGKSQDHHSTTAYLLLSNTHTTHTFQWNTLHCMTIKGRKFKGEFNPTAGEWWLPPTFYRWFYLLFTRIYVCELETHASCWQHAWRLNTAK